MTYKADAAAANLTAACMGLGFHRGVVKHPEGSLVGAAAANSGYIGVFQALSEYAAVSEQLLEALNMDDFPGVYEYEVSEPFGEWFAAQCIEFGDVPEQKHGRTTLAERIAEFFTQMDEGTARADLKVQYMHTMLKALGYIETDWGTT